MGPKSGASDFDVVFHVASGRRVRKWFPSHWSRFPHGHCDKKVGIVLQLVIMTVSLAIVVVAD